MPRWPKTTAAKGRHPETNKTHCPSGHEYDEPNTRLYSGRRYCRTCDRARQRKAS